MTVPRDIPQPPPADLANRDLAGQIVSFSDTLVRISHEKAPLVDWSDNAESRFSHPTLKFKVLYLGPRKEPSFWERFGQEIRDQPLAARAIARRTLAERVWKTFVIEPHHNLRCLDLTRSDTLRVMGADGATFAAPYAITQAWAGELMKHPAGIEALIYESRLDKPQKCLAVFQHHRFGAAANLFGVTLHPVRPIVDPELLALLVKERISVLRPSL